jgi:hypothetical protein
MPTTYRRRMAPCTQCGDAVLISEGVVGRLFGLNLPWKPTIRLQHADPGPSGEVFDAVDRGCRRPRVTN